MIIGNAVMIMAMMAYAVNDHRECSNDHGYDGIYVANDHRECSNDHGYVGGVCSK